MILMTSSSMNSTLCRFWNLNFTIFVKRCFWRLVEGAIKSSWRLTVIFQKKMSTSNSALLLKEFIQEKLWKLLWIILFNEFCKCYNRKLTGSPAKIFSNDFKSVLNRFYFFDMQHMICSNITLVRILGRIVASRTANVKWRHFGIY